MLAKAQLVNLLLQDLVQAFKHGGIEFVARQAEGLSGDHALLKVRSIEYLKKRVQLGLQGRTGLVEKKQDGVFEGQMTATGKILGPAAVGCDKIGTIKQIG